jgi:hypothetical protein
MNQERFEWLATSIRSSKGQAAVAHVCSFDELRNEQIEHMFNEARTREYQLLEKELKRLAKPPNRDKSEPGFLRLKRRLQQIIEIDFSGPLYVLEHFEIRLAEVSSGSWRHVPAKTVHVAGTQTNGSRHAGSKDWNSALNGRNHKINDWSEVGPERREPGGRSTPYAS